MSKDKNLNILRHGLAAQTGRPVNTITDDEVRQFAGPAVVARTEANKAAAEAAPTKPNQAPVKATSQGKLEGVAMFPDLEAPHTPQAEKLSGHVTDIQTHMKGSATAPGETPSHADVRVRPSRMDVNIPLPTDIDDANPRSN